MTDNPSPVVYDLGCRENDLERGLTLETLIDAGDEDGEPLDSVEVFDTIRGLRDPEHPYSLEQLKVVEPGLISVNNDLKIVSVRFTPTIPHCSQALLIGLMICVKLMRGLPRTYKIEVRIQPGSHETEEAINKQLNDKERLLAAIESPGLLDKVNKGICNTDEWHDVLKGAGISLW
eukprot:Selendium_serpulae@DN5035_c0_g1_i5.p1